MELRKHVHTNKVQINNRVIIIVTYMVKLSYDIYVII